MEASVGPEVVARYARVLADHDISYLVVGAFAVMAHGFPRFSSDLDIAVNVAFEARNTVQVILEDHGCTTFEEREDPQWGQRLACATEEGITLETFFASENAVSTREFSRAVTKKIGDYDVRFISPEDLVLRKLVNTRLRRSVDYDDALGVLARNWTTFDRDYVRSHCGPHRICGLFEKALDEAKAVGEDLGDGR